MRKYGISNFEVKKGALYVFGREVVIDAKRKKEILAELEEGVEL